MDFIKLQYFFLLHCLYTLLSRCVSVLNPASRLLQFSKCYVVFSFSNNSPFCISPCCLCATCFDRSWQEIFSTTTSSLLLGASAAPVKTSRRKCCGSKKQKRERSFLIFSVLPVTCTFYSRDLN